MLDRQIVRRDVGLTVRNVVVRSTIFSDETYNSSIVPKEEPMKGWEANRANWGMILKAIEVELHHMEPEYKVLNVDSRDATATLKKPLFDTSERLTNKIMEGNEQL